MLRELGIADQPETILDDYGTDRRRTASEGRCCGFGGLFSVKLPEISIAMADEVLDALVASGASRVVGCDASCLLHLRGRAQKRGINLEFAHLAEVVDNATEGEL
jgi:L-lactate dehydrogenase complex protein LldE